MTTVVDELGKQVLTRRKELGLAQSDLADLAGVSGRSIYALEHGKATIRLDTLISIASTLGLELTLTRRA